jgi:hypothetical protein
LASSSVVPDLSAVFAVHLLSASNEQRSTGHLCSVAYAGAIDGSPPSIHVTMLHARDTASPRSSVQKVPHSQQSSIPITPPRNYLSSVRAQRPLIELASLAMRTISAVAQPRTVGPHTQHNSTSPRHLHRTLNTDVMTPLPRTPTALRQAVLAHLLLAF